MINSQTKFILLISTHIHHIEVFLAEEKLMTAKETCHLAAHSQCIAYDKPHCLHDGIAENRYKNHHIQFHN